MAASAGSFSPSLQMNNKAERKQRTLWGDAWVQFRRNKLSMLGMTVLAVLFLAILIGPYLYRVDPEHADTKLAMEVLLDDAKAAPSVTHPFGVDDLGRDTLARNLSGGRISLAVGLIAMIIAMFVGTVVGLLSGFLPTLDGPLMRLTDMMLALPQVPLLLVLILLFRDSLRTLLGPELGIFLLVVFVIGILGWMPTARIVRGQVLSIKQKEFVEAAVNIGSRQGSIMFRHILPNVVSPIIVAATLQIANAILTESVLSFLGLGFPSDVPTWGRLLFEGKDFISTNPWVSIFPGLFISFTILSINFMGDGLRDALDPRQRQ